jgi:hypothetical protein
MMKTPHWQKMMLIAFAVTVMVNERGAGGEEQAAAKPAKEKKVKPRGPLANLPSKPGPHIEKMRSLADNGWLTLSAPAADPKWGKARGRAWGCSMPLAPDLRGAFLFGEGVHGYTKPDDHYMDDLWFYDLNGHRWICCYPGANVKTLELTITRDGFEATKNGEAIPVASMAHAYEMVTYDTDLKRFMSMPCPGEYWKKPLKRRIQWLKDLPKDAAKGASPWMFDVTTGKWDRRASATIHPRSGFGDVLVYVTGRKQAFFRNNDGVWFYDPATNKWAAMKPKGPKPPFGIDPTACYDSKRERIYLGGGSYPVVPRGSNALWIYDIKANTWVDPRPKGAPCKGSTSYNTNVAAMHYDSVNDVVVLFRHGGDKEERGIFVFDPTINSWVDNPKLTLKATGQCMNAFYDPELNAHIFQAASDSVDNGTIWAYRYKQPK